MAELACISEGVRVGKLERSGEELLEVGANHRCLVGWGSINNTVGVGKEDVGWSFSGEETPEVFERAGVIFRFGCFHAGVKSL